MCLQAGPQDAAGSAEQSQPQELAPLSGSITPLYPQDTGPAPSHVVLQQAIASKQVGARASTPYECMEQACSESAGPPIIIAKQGNNGESAEQGDNTGSPSGSGAPCDTVVQRLEFSFKPFNSHLDGSPAQPKRFAQQISTAPLLGSDTAAGSAVGAAALPASSTPLSAAPIAAAAARVPGPAADQPVVSGANNADMPQFAVADSPGSAPPAALPSASEQQAADSAPTGAQSGTGQPSAAAAQASAEAPAPASLITAQLDLPTPAPTPPEPEDSELAATGTAPGAVPDAVPDAVPGAVPGAVPSVHEGSTPAANLSDSVPANADACGAASGSEPMLPAPLSNCSSATKQAVPVAAAKGASEPRPAAKAAAETTVCTPSSATAHCQGFFGYISCSAEPCHSAVLTLLYDQLTQVILPPSCLNLVDSCFRCLYDWFV